MPGSRTLDTLIAAVAQAFNVIKSTRKLWVIAIDPENAPA
jgi:hypothetical protein